ncbi:hypothetical protein MMC13_003667 [Lambiella insularis]|nr:hypothetical protein [Lambiella insularis]
MNRRQANQTNQFFTPPLLENASTADKLYNQLSTDNTDSPKEILSRLLSEKSTTSTTSSDAQRQPEAANNPESQTFRQIGVGTCATVFEYVVSGYVLKKQNSEALSVLPDYKMHALIRDSFAKHLWLEIKLPKPMDFISKKETDWWSIYLERFPTKYATPANIIVSERILPLSKAIRDALVEQYVPPNLAKDKEHIKAPPANRDCLARVYLGKRRRQDRQRPPPFFSLRNFNLHIDQMEELGLDVTAFTDTMADALAVLHWEAKIDAEDVEFVLGGRPTAIFNEAPSFHELEKNTDWMTGTISMPKLDKRAVYMWVLDFNRCQQISMDETGLKQAVRAFYRNDPYYPRPESDNPKDEAVWERFSTRYLAASKRVLGDRETKLPSKFVEMLVLEGERKAMARKEAEIRASSIK